MVETFAKGETLDYTVNWMKVVGGTARMTIAPDGDARWRITSVAKSGGGLARFVKVRDEIETIVDRSDFSTLRYSKKLDERGDKMEEVTTIENGVASRKRKKIKRSRCPARSTIRSRSSITSGRSSSRRGRCTSHADLGREALHRPRPGDETREGHHAGRDVRRPAGRATDGQRRRAATAGLVAERFGWRAVFVLTGLLLIGAMATALAALRGEPRPPPEPFAARSILDRYGLVLANPKAIRLHALIMLAGGAAFGILPYVAAILARRLGTGSAEAGLVIAGFGIGGVLFAVVIRIVFQQLGAARMGRLGGLAGAAAVIAFALPLPWIWDVALFVVFGFFYYMLHNTLQALAADLAPSARGSAVSLFAFSMFTAQGLGPIVVGQMLDAAAPMPVLIGLGLVLAGVGLTAERVLFR